MGTVLKVLNGDKVTVISAEKAELECPPELMASMKLLWGNTYTVTRTTKEDDDLYYHWIEDSDGNELDMYLIDADIALVNGEQPEFVDADEIYGELVCA